jgi:hypothetical protein
MRTLRASAVLACAVVLAMLGGTAFADAAADTRDALVRAREATAAAETAARLAKDRAAAAARGDGLGAWREAHDAYLVALGNLAAVREGNAVAIASVQVVPPDLQDRTHRAVHEEARGAAAAIEERTIAQVRGTVVMKQATEELRSAKLRTLSYEPCTNCTAAQPPQSPEQGERVLARLPPRMRYAHRRTIAPEFDRFLNETEVWLRSFKVRDGFVWNLHFRAGFGFKGTTLTHVPTHVVLLFNSWSEIGQGWRYLWNHRLTFLADGVTVDVGDAGHSGSVGFGLDEVMLAVVPVETFLRLANSRTLEGRLGVDSFRFSAQDILAMRDLASRMRP